TLFVLVFVHINSLGQFVLVCILALIPAAHFLQFYAPSAIPHFTLVSSIGPLTKYKVLRKIANDKRKAEAQKNGNPAAAHTSVVSHNRVRDEPALLQMSAR